ncbi:reductive dehalogenase [Dehalococcoides mccartyi]|uniref:reductive dehalogenase n=1 Tax=Dehalococcoides mccartyi TaxID=61435 RepID=UPI0002B76F28|nr:reductive dehalogenase [Dehalococcoides mccartyi]AGG05714.1 reductive dehalogenase [Dehalococcoides mccartyi DCMB5]
MSRFHSTLSRRDFMRGIGLASVGLGTLSSVTPRFTDLDEIISDEKANYKQPWWVREQDQGVTEVDWDKKQTFNQAQYDNRVAHLRPSPLDDEYRTLPGTPFSELYYSNMKTFIQENKPGFSLRDRGIYWGWASPMIKDVLGYRRAGGIGSGSGESFTGYDFLDLVDTPESIGVPRWEGTPEENSRMLRSALKLMGASTVGFVEINDNNKKLVFTGSSLVGKPVVWEDTENIYQTNEKQVIPNKCKWAVVYTIRQPLETTKRGPSWISDGAVGIAYDQCDIVQYRLQAFLKCIGYQAVGGNLFGLGPLPAWGELSGLGEVGRLQNLITPEFGPLIRESKFNLIDLPVAPTKPVNFGAQRFCHTCLKCADACPGNALQKNREPSWDITPKYDEYVKPELFNSPGHKTWYFDHFKCRKFWEESASFCGVCQGTCVFSKEKLQSIHEFVKPVIGQTSLFNSFFYNMDRAFGYGLHSEDIENWWDMNLPTFNIDYSEKPYI